MWTCHNLMDRMRGLSSVCVYAYNALETVKVFLTYLAMHLCQGNCSDWRVCFLRPDTEWNAAGTEKRWHKSVKLYTRRNSAALNLSRCGSDFIPDTRKLPSAEVQYTVWNLDLCTRPDSSELSLSCQVCLLLLLSSVQPHPTSSHSCGLKKRAKRSTQHSECCCEQTWWEFWECRRFTLWYDAFRPHSCLKWIWRANKVKQTLDLCTYINEGDCVHI